MAVLRALWQGWKRMAARIGHFQSRLILVLIYFVVAGPLALVMRFAAEPLGGRRAGSTWIERERTTSLETARRQF